MESFWSFENLPSCESPRSTCPLIHLICPVFFGRSVYVSKSIYLARPLYFVLHPTGLSRDGGAPMIGSSHGPPMPRIDLEGDFIPIDAGQAHHIISAAASLVDPASPEQKKPPQIREWGGPVWEILLDTFSRARNPAVTSRSRTQPPPLRRISNPNRLCLPLTHTLRRVQESMQWARRMARPKKQI